jgi:predicted dehydrogenase
MKEIRDMTRRDAAKVAGAAAVAAAYIPKLNAANNQVQWGMIGTGSRGSYLLRHLKGIDEGRCVALCDVNEENLRKGVDTIGNNPKTYKDYRELLADKNIEAVLVVTPLYMHFPVTKDALLAGKHVFCEKSLVFTAPEVVELRALSSSRPKQVVQVGLQRRYSKYYQTVRQMIEKGLLGNVTHVNAQWHRNGLASTWVVKPGNWRVYRKYSGGLTTELASHQIDIADWMFGSHPEFVTGVGDLTWYKDGRDIYDNIQLIFKYPQGQKLVYTSNLTSSHLPYLGSSRTEFGEMIMGTQATVEITVGDDNLSPIAMWYREPENRARTVSGPKQENTKAGATMVAGAGGKGLPVLFEEDKHSGNESFIQKELKFARQWLYAKGIMVPEEGKNPVDTAMESFFNDVRTGGRPKADLEVGLADSTACILANLAMDEGRRVYMNEIEKLGKVPAAEPAKAAAKA